MRAMVSVIRMCSNIKGQGMVRACFPLLSVSHLLPSSQLSRSACMRQSTRQRQRSLILNLINDSNSPQSSHVRIIYTA